MPKWLKTSSHYAVMLGTGPSRGGRQQVESRQRRDADGTLLAPGHVRSDTGLSLLRNPPSTMKHNSSANRLAKTGDSEMSWLLVPGPGSLTPACGPRGILFFR